MPTALEELIGGLFSTVFGSPIMVGVFGLLMLGVIGVAVGLSFEGFLIFLAPVMIYLAIAGYLPYSLLWAVVLGCGFIIFMAIMRLMNR